MQNTPKISAIIPTCDRMDYLPEAINSIRAQTLQATEIIVVNNGKEPLPEGSLGDDVKILNLKHYVGVSAARNAGAEAAKGNYLAFLDDDDLWDKDFLNHLTHKLKAEKAHCAVADIYFFNEATKPYLHSSFANTATEKNFRKKILIKNHGFGGANFIILKKAFNEVNKFDEDLKYGEDRVFACKLLFNEYSIVGGKKARYYARTHKNPRLTNAGKPELNKNCFKDRMQSYYKLKQWMTFWQKIEYITKCCVKITKYRIKSIFGL